MTDDVPTVAEPSVVAADPVVVGPFRRRTVDTLLVAAGALVAVVLLVAGGLLTWGSRFASDYVGDELTAQNIFFPPEDALKEEGRTDLLGHAAEQVTTGEDAQAYASSIAHHLEGIADGPTYADLGEPESAAKSAVDDATANGADDAEVAELQGQVDAIGGQRNALFKGETLRGLLLSTYAWSTIGRIAGIAAIAAFAAAAVMVVLVVLGAVHRRRLAAI